MHFNFGILKTTMTKDSKQDSSIHGGLDRKCVA